MAVTIVLLAAIIVTSKIFSVQIVNVPVQVVMEMLSISRAHRAQIYKIVKRYLEHYSVLLYIKFLQEKIKRPFNYPQDTNTSKHKKDEDSA